MVFLLYHQLQEKQRKIEGQRENNSDWYDRQRKGPANCGREVRSKQRKKKSDCKFYKDA